MDVKTLTDAQIDAAILANSNERDALKEKAKALTVERDLRAAKLKLATTLQGLPADVREQLLSGAA